MTLKLLLVMDVTVLLLVVVRSMWYQNEPYSTATQIEHYIK